MARKNVPRWRCVFFLVLAVICLSGCDFVSPEEQTVTLLVRDASQGNLLSGAKVTLVRVDDPGLAIAGDEESFLAGLTDLSATTDSNGKASPKSRISILCTGGITTIFESCPGEPIDHVTSFEFVVRIESESVTELLRGEVQEGAILEGDRYTVAILSIGLPG